MTIDEMVDTQVIEPLDIKTTYTPAVIQYDLSALEIRVGEMLELYTDYTPDVSNSDLLQQAKRERAWLNAQSKDLNQRRIALKKRYMEPYERFESALKPIIARIDNVSKLIDTAIKAQEAAEKQAKYDTMKEFYEDFAGLLAPVLPFEKVLAGEKWLNKTCTTWQTELENKVSKIAREWDTLKGAHLTYEKDAERVFFDTLDLGTAMDKAREIEEQNRRIAELKAQVEPEHVAPTRCQPAPAVDVWEYEPEPEPVPVIQSTQQLIETMTIESEPRMSFVILLDNATETQARSIDSFIGSFPGVKHELCKGNIFQTVINKSRG